MERPVCIVPSLQCQRGSHSSLRTIQTPAHLVWKLQGDLHAHTKTCICTCKCLHRSKHKHSPVHKECCDTWMHMRCAERTRHWNVKDCIHFLPPTHRLTSTSSVVLFPMWFTGHFTLGQGGHLQCWPCTAAQGHVYSIWQHFPKNPTSHKATMPCQSPLMKVLILSLEGLKCCFHIGQSFHCYSQLSMIRWAGLHCSTALSNSIYNALALRVCRRTSVSYRWLLWMAYEYRENEMNLFHCWEEDMPLLRTCQCVH